MGLAWVFAMSMPFVFPFMLGDVEQTAARPDQALGIHVLH